MTRISRRAVWRLTVAPLFLWLAGCSPEQGAASAGGAPGSPAVPTQRDSAGVAILEYPPDVAQRVPQWTVDTNPIAIIGDDPDGSDDVTHVSTPLLLSGGIVIVWLGDEARLAAFGPDGAERWHLGQRGQGPTDFGFVDQIFAVGDTAFIPDFGNDRLAMVSAAGAWIGSVRGLQSCGPEPVEGRFPDGSLLAGSYLRYPALPVTDTIMRLPSPVLRIGTDICDTLVLAPGPEMNVVAFRPRGRSQTTPRFVRYGRNSVSALWDSLVALGTGERYQIDLLDQTGRVMKSLRLDWTPETTPEGALDSVIGRDLERLHGVGERSLDPAESERLIREETYVSAKLPPYYYFKTSTDGTLWVMDGWAPGIPERTALAFADDGTIQARLHLPSRFLPMAFGSDRVLTRVEDPETGVVTFRVLRMRPAKQ
ncbi:MAG TPA: hypothetical protein VFI41_08245 [Gemmatimonadales bacterium]|jgi:hypothetical protein|nr:hypothetical protein [Gemmatimonadales bacterium]